MDKWVRNFGVSVGFVMLVGVCWFDIDMYQYVNYVIMVMIFEEVWVLFFKDVFGVDIMFIGLLIVDVWVIYKG